MEKRGMEESWGSFWQSGRIEDYLNYRNCVGNGEEQKKECREDGRAGCSDRDGADRHANIGL